VVDGDGRLKKPKNGVCIDAIRLESDSCVAMPGRSGGDQ
jgi:hypothetical protein